MAKKYNSPKFSDVSQVFLGKQLILAVVLIFAAVAGLKLLNNSKAASFNGDHSACSGLKLSATKLVPGQSISATYTLTNNGTTNWDPGRGYQIGNHDGGIQYTYGYVFGSVHAAGGSFAVKTGIKAPTTAGSYRIDPGVYVVGHPQFASWCAAQTINVYVPASIKSFSASPSTINQGKSSFISWSTTNSFGTSCQLSFGSQKLNNLGATAGITVKPSITTSYKLTCGNPISTSAPRTIKLTVKQPTSTKSTKKTSGPVPTPAIKDTEAPSVPGNFIANNNSDNKTVDLSWDASTDNKAVAGYEIENSTDQNTWLPVNGSVTGTTYEDDNVNFDTVYYYRIRAYDAAHNKSDYAVASISSADFQPNVNKDQDATITSDDGIASITIPSGSIDGEAYCAVVSDNSVASPKLSSYVAVAGPYQLNCKDKDSKEITKFNSSLQLQAKIDRSTLQKNITSLEYYGLGSDGKSWEKLTIKSIDPANSTETVDLGSHLTFTILGKQKKSNPVITVIIVILVIILIVGILLLGTRFVVSFLLKRKAQQEYDDYLKKSQGL